MLMWLVYGGFPWNPDASLVILTALRCRERQTRHGRVAPQQWPVNFTFETYFKKTVYKLEARQS